MDKITDYIYIGDWESSIDRKQLIDNKIKTIICIFQFTFFHQSMAFVFNFSSQGLHFGGVRGRRRNADLVMRN